MRNRYVLFIAGLGAILQLSLVAQQPIGFDTTTRVLRIDAAQSTYAFGIGAEGQLQNIYRGGRLMPTDPLPAVRNEKEPIVFESATAFAPQEYGAWGNGMYIEPALKVSVPDGNRDLVLPLSVTVRPPSAREWET